MKIKRFLRKAALFALILTMLIIPAMQIGVKAAQLSGTVNLAFVRQNAQGEGYYWDNVKKILTLNGLNINTDEAWGLRLPDNATIELHGTNTIKAAKYALGCPGNVTIKGDGKLILESGEYAIFVHSQTDAHKFRVFEGEIVAKGGKSAFYSEIAEFSMIGGKIDFSSDGEYTVNSRVFAMTGGSAVVKGTLRTTHLLRLNEATLNVTDDKLALKTENLFEHDNVKLFAGNSESALAEVEDFSDGKLFKTEAIPSGPRDSIIFGEGTPITADYILLAVVIVLVSGAFAVPVIRKKQKTKKLYEELEASKTVKKK